MTPFLELGKQTIQHQEFPAAGDELLVNPVFLSLRDQRVFQKVRMVATLPQLHHDVDHLDVEFSTLGPFLCFGWSVKK